MTSIPLFWLAMNVVYIGGKATTTTVKPVMAKTLAITYIISYWNMTHELEIAKYKLTLTTNRENKLSKVRNYIQDWS